MEDMKFLTVAEIATLTRLSKMTIYRLIQHGELEGVRFGRSFRVRERAVQDYMNSHTT
jgi:excisionase family DNA binding protein